MEYIKAKTILARVKGNDTWFGLMYNMNLYRGCQHGCIYCDTRSDCYRVGDISNIKIKENCIEILEKEMRTKVVKGTIGFGSMNDPYMPLEEKENLTREALKLCLKYGFPVHIITKGILAVRDIDLLKEIGEKSYSAVSFTITSADDKIASEIEPAAPSSSKRFEAMKKLSEAGIYTGITFMPLLPYINDTEENIIEIARLAHENGAKYIIPSFGVTLRDSQREYFYKELDKRFPGIKEKYIRKYGTYYSCTVPKSKMLYEVLKKECEKYEIPLKMKIYEPEINPMWKLF